MLVSPTEVVENLKTTELLHDREFEHAARAAVQRATRRIWIMAYSWKWYTHEPQKSIQQFNQAVVSARKRGVVVRALLQDPGLVPFFKELGFQVRVMPKGRILHTKAITVDDKCLFIGSHNLTDRAFDTNLELSVKVTDFEAVQQFQSYFDRFWNNVGV